jgi:hypothetical protein
VDTLARDKAKMGQNNENIDQEDSRYEAKNCPERREIGLYL